MSQVILCFHCYRKERKKVYEVTTLSVLVSVNVFAFVYLQLTLRNYYVYVDAACYKYHAINRFDGGDTVVFLTFHK